MREFLSVTYLILLQTISLLLTALGSSLSTAGSFFHITFVRNATQHDIKYATDKPVTPEKSIDEKWSN